MKLLGSSIEEERPNMLSRWISSEIRTNAIATNVNLMKHLPSPFKTMY